MNKKIEEIAEQIVFSLTEGYDEEDISVVGDIITSAVSEAQKKQMEVDIAYKNQCVEAETERCANKSKEKAQEMSSSKGRGQDEATMIYVIGREIAKAIRIRND